MAEVLGAIWDMDGTLVDTAEQHFNAWETVCTLLGRDFTRADFAATFGRRNPEIISHLFGDLFDAEQVASIGERKEVMYRAAAERQGVSLLPGVEELLRGLHALGVRQAIGSSAPRANLDLLLRLTGTESFFQAVVGMEQTSRGKPDPQVFLVGADLLGVPPGRCIVFEDAIAGVQAARAGGMKCVAVTYVGHHPEAKLRAAGADLVVENLNRISSQTILDLLSR